MSPSRLLLPAILAQPLVAWAAWRATGTDTIPTHWNVHGVADATGPRIGTATVFTLLTATVGTLLVVMEGADPRLRASPLTLRRYRQFLSGFLLALVALHAAIQSGADVGRHLPVAMGVFFALLGYTLRDIAPNGVMGFRTPWTLGSDLAWRRAHAQTAWAFGVGGALTAVAGLWRPEAAFATLMTTVLGGALLITWRSRGWYAEDPERRPLRWW
jgi:uncharacterized membrane protein